MVQSYKCPSCGAAIVYDGEKQKMYCPYCETELDLDEVEEVSSYFDEEEPEVSEEAREAEVTGESLDFRGYHCENCGAQLLTDDATAATFCSFCGSPALIENRLSGEKKPMGLIPFKISKEKAVEAYKAWTKKGVLTPSVFRSQATLEKISGIYVPYFLHDYDADIHLEATAEKVRVTRFSDTEYIYTDHYRLYRHMGVRFENIPADASKNMEDVLMERLEAYDYRDMKVFEMPYLSGFLAEKYTVEPEELRGRVEDRVNRYSQVAVRDTLQGFSGYQVVSERIRKNRTKLEYVLLPVWMLNYRYKGQLYTFAMNGQSGKVTANLPISVGKAVGIFAGIAGVFSVLSIVIGGLL